MENTVLACFICYEQCQDYIDSLTEEDFSTTDNKIIFNILSDLHKNGSKIDYITVSNKMTWGSVSIKVLPTLNSFESYSNIDEYIRILKQETAKRRIKEILSQSNMQIINDEKVEEVYNSIITEMDKIDLGNENRLVDVGLINPNDYENRIRVKSNIKPLDNMIGGFCLGELSVWTGKSGQGKSTLLSQLMLNAVNQGFKVCAYSGELINTQFQHWLILQACGSNNLVRTYDKDKQCDVYLPSKEAKEKICNWLKGKFYLYNNEFSSKNNNIIDTFKMAHKKYGCQVFLVDNLMTAKYNSNDKENYYLQQSNFVGELVRFAKTQNVHVHLIAHPKKTQGELSKEDIAGTLDISNRADNTFSVSRNDNTNLTEVRILKNRSDGLQNRQICLNFDVNSKRFTATDNEMYKFKKYGWED